MTITKSITIDGGHHIASILASGTNGVNANITDLVADRIESGDEDGAATWFTRVADDLRRHVDAVIYTYGASVDRHLAWLDRPAD